MPEANFTPRPIADVAAELNLTRDDYEPYGWHKAKLAEGLAERLGDRPRGRLIGVTAISPTPLGEGKTVVSIGLAMALCRLGHQTIVTLREPSLAPVFGIKGGGAGGGAAQLLPRDDINLHFTGDLHAVTSATNLLAAMLDNHVQRRKSPRIAPDAVTWRRCVDMSDQGPHPDCHRTGALAAGTGSGDRLRPDRGFGSDGDSRAGPGPKRSANATGANCRRPQ